MDLSLLLKAEQLRLEGQENLLTREKEKLFLALEGYEEESTRLEQALNLVKDCIKESAFIKKDLEILESSALTDIFGTPYEYKFEATFDKQGELTGYLPKLSKEGGPFRSLERGFGSSIAATADVVMWMSALLLSKETDNILIADEILSEVNPDMWGRVIKWAEETCRKVGLQLILITHMPAIGGTVYKVSQRLGKSTVTKLH